MNFILILLLIVIIGWALSPIEKYLRRLINRIDDLESRVDELESPNISDSDEYPN